MKKRVLAALLAVCLLIGTGVTFALAKDEPETYAEEGKYYYLDKILKEEGFNNLEGQYYSFMKREDVKKSILPSNPCKTFEISPKDYDAADNAVVKESLNRDIDKYNVDTFFNLNTSLKDAITNDVVIVTSNSTPDDITVTFSMNSNTDLVPMRASYVYLMKKTLADGQEPVKDEEGKPTGDYTIIDKGSEPIKASDYEKIPYYSFTYSTKLYPVQTEATEITVTLKRVPEFTTYAIEGQDFLNDLKDKTYFDVSREKKVSTENCPDYKTYSIEPKAYIHTYTDKKITETEPVIDSSIFTVEKIDRENIGNYLKIDPSLAKDENVKVDFTKKSDNKVEITFSFENAGGQKIYTLLKDLQDEEAEDGSFKSMATKEVDSADYEEVSAKRFIYKTENKDGKMILDQQGSTVKITLRASSTWHKSAATTYGKKGDVFSTNLDGKKYRDISDLRKETDPEKTTVVNPQMTTNNRFTITPKEEAFTIGSDVLTINKGNVNHYFNLSANLQSAIKDDVVCVMGVFGPYDETVYVNFSLNPKKIGNSFEAYRLTRDLTDAFDRTNEVYIDQSNTIVTLDEDPNDGKVYDYEIINMYTDYQNSAEDYHVSTYEFDCNVVDANGSWKTTRNYDDVTYIVEGVKRTPQRDPIGHLEFTWNLWKNLKDLGNWIKGAFTFVLRLAWEPFRWVLSYIVDIKPVF
ncbi:MAG: hypothetical protein IKW76_06155 [Clostridia bacterium]|nr:hypothetical protein [Clostridia bacterium]